MKTIHRTFRAATAPACRCVLGIPVVLCMHLVAGCGSSSDAGNKTTGARVALHTVVAADPEINSAFTTSFGWNVTLTKAAVAIGALYYFDGPPAFVRFTPPKLTPLERFEKFLGLGIAYAHPGHYQAGDAMGQMVTPSSFDLFSAQPGTLGDGEGVTGTFRSARFVFAKSPTGPATDALDGHIAIAEGSATKADGSSPSPIYFRVTADFADVAKSVSEGQVDGCEFKETAVQGNGTVHLAIRPSIWFSFVDFSTVAPGTASAPTTLAAGEKPQVGFALGLVQLTAYHFELSN